jgi:hypothetical protein
VFGQFGSILNHLVEFLNEDALLETQLFEGGTTEFCVSSAANLGNKQMIQAEKLIKDPVPH